MKPLHALLLTTIMFPAAGAADSDRPDRQHQQWNLARDIATTQNQIGFDQRTRGVWYFMVSSSANHDARRYRFLREYNAPALPFTDISIPVGFSCWQEPAQVLPDVCFNFNDASVRLESFDVPPHTVDMHPYQDQYSIVAWRSPLQGSISIEGSFQDLDDHCGNGILATIDRNSEILFFEDLPDGTGAHFHLPKVRVNEDDVLYFIVDAKNFDYVCDSTALDLTITRIGERD